jgi:hypothetical protein
MAMTGATATIRVPALRHPVDPQEAARAIMPSGSSG